MKRLDLNGSGELKKRAKVLYFDANPKLEKIYVDSFGRFSFSQKALAEQLKHVPDAMIYTIKKSDVKNLKVDESEYIKKPEPKKEDGRK